MLHILYSSTPSPDVEPFLPQLGGCQRNAAVSSKDMMKGIQLRMSWRRIVGVACAALAAYGVGASAQTAGDGGVAVALETRAALEAKAVTAEAQHRTGEALLLRSRLERGDFQDGDRIVVKLLGSGAMVPNLMGANDTIVLRAGKRMQLPQMEDLSLDGVLRSELNAKVSSHLAKYLKDSTVSVTPLIRLAVVGQVRAPSFYYTTVDVLLSDMIVKAGGPNGNADWLGNVEIRRGTETIWSAKDARTAMTDGISLERLNLRTGDEIYVDEQKSGFSWSTVFQVLGTLTGLAYTLQRFVFR
jgi:hypothetical protein